MTLMAACTASTNPGLPGFARFWGPGFLQTPLLGQRAADAARARLATKTFLQESIRARPDGSRPSTGSDRRRGERNFPVGKFLGRRYFDAFNRVRRWLLRSPAITSTGWRSRRFGVSGFAYKEGP
jgi:hypothetical protein